MASVLTKVEGFLERELRGKLRVWLSWIILPLILFNVTETPHWYGILFLLAGGFIRFWASGYLQKEGQLCANGPYLISRNPLYLGSIMIAMGLPISQDAWILTVFVWIASLAMYYPLIRKEERVLTPKFGRAYHEYLAKIPRLVSPYSLLNPLRAGVLSVHTEKSEFRWSMWKHNKGWEPMLVCGGLLAVGFLLSAYR